MAETIIDPLLLFQFSLPLQHHELKWNARGMQLPEACRIPNLRALLGDGPSHGDLRMAWNAEGLFLQLTVSGKQQTLWCRRQRPDDSDGLQIYLSVRDASQVRRATRFCHRFVLLPTDENAASSGPSLHHLPIPRAAERANPVPPNSVRITSHLRSGGYEMAACWPWEALPGFHLGEQDVLGFTYALCDRELGLQSLALGPEYPLSDPSLWSRLHLARPPRTR